MGPVISAAAAQELLAAQADLRQRGGTPILLDEGRWPDARDAVAGADGRDGGRRPAR